MKNNYEKREKCVCVWMTMKHIGTQSMQKKCTKEREKKIKLNKGDFLFELNSVNGKHNKT